MCIIQTFWSGGHDPLECGYGIYQNDKLFCSIPISSNGLPRDMIYAKGHVPVGQCEVALPKTDVLFGYHPCVGDSSLYDSYVEMIDDFWALRAIPDSVFYDKAVAITCGLRYDADAQSLWHDHLLDILTRRDREAERLIDRVALLRRGHQMQFWSFVWSAIVDVDDGGKRDFHRAYWALSQDGRDL